MQSSRALRIALVLVAFVLVTARWYSHDSPPPGQDDNRANAEREYSGHEGELDESYVNQDLLSPSQAPSLSSSVIRYPTFEKGSNMSILIVGANFGVITNCPIRCEYTASTTSKAHAGIYNSQFLIPPHEANAPKLKIITNKEAPLCGQNSLEACRKYDLYVHHRLDADVPFVVAPKDVPLSAYLRWPAPKGDKNIFWASSCGDKMAPGKHARLAWVLHIHSRIKVDFYGSCEHNSEFEFAIPPPPPGRKYAHNNPLGKLQKMVALKDYRFTFAFENKVAPYYVTEKFFQALEAGVVPIYLGTRDISYFRPGDHSYIDVSDFQAPVDLSRYLTYLMNNETAYQEYFAWKNKPLRPQFIRAVEHGVVESYVPPERVRTLKTHIARTIQDVDEVRRLHDKIDYFVYPPQPQRAYSPECRTCLLVARRLAGLSSRPDRMERMDPMPSAMKNAAREEGLFPDDRESLLRDHFIDQLGWDAPFVAL